MEIYNTFGIPATSQRYLVLTQEEELRCLLSEGLQSPYFILGGGSNVVFTGHYPGTIVHLANKGIRLLSTHDGQVLVEAAAGEEWDHFVRYAMSQGWHGMENLVAIPGCVGASPVQNVGAYGLEAKDVIHSVRAFEIATGNERVFTNEECHFGYRSSIFKHELKDRYIIWSVTFCLSTTFTPNCRYKAITDALEAKGITTPDAQQLADTITEVRWSKLPRPEELGSAGSFFKNPVVDADHYQRLLAAHPDIVAYPVPEGYKLAAGWLIEHAGWKGRNLGPCGVYERQALVLVNRGGCTGDDVLALSRQVVSDVSRIFGVTLEPEAIFV